MTDFFSSQSSRKYLGFSVLSKYPTPRPKLEPAERNVGNVQAAIGAKSPDDRHNGISTICSFEG
jgi:hypothetical protein